MVARNTEGGSITVPLTSCLTGLDWSVLKIKTKIVCSHTADSKPVKQEVNGTVIIPLLVFSDGGDRRDILAKTQHSFVARQSILCYGEKSVWFVLQLLYFSFKLFTSQIDKY
jgi:hypothetical protein